MSDLGTMIAALQSFTPSVQDRNYSGDQQLRRWFYATVDLPEATAAIPAMLAVVARFPDTYFAFQHLANAVERCPAYEEIVIQAAYRMPTPLNLICVNRLRSHPEFDPYDSVVFQQIIEDALYHHHASDATKKQAQAILNARPIELICADFEQLTLSPDSDYTSLEQVAEWCAELLNTPEPKLGIRSILGVMERYPYEDLDLLWGFIHTIEEISDYETVLLESIHRKPVPLTLTMVNRIANSVHTAAELTAYLAIYEGVLANDQILPITREEAQSYLNYQQERLRQITL